MTTTTPSSSSSPRPIPKPICSTPTDTSQPARFAMSKGRWEGNLTAYDAQARQLTRQPTVLFIEPKYSSILPIPLPHTHHQDPEMVSLALRRPTESRDVQMDFDHAKLSTLFSNGLAFGFHGEISSGAAKLEKNKMVVMEFGLNTFTPGRDAGEVQGRARSIVRYLMPENVREGSEGAVATLSGVSVFRERASKGDIAKERKEKPELTQVPAEIVDSDLVDIMSVDQLVHCTTMDEYLSILDGTWDGVCEVQIVGDDMQIKKSMAIQYEMVLGYDKEQRQATYTMNMITENGASKKLLTTGTVNVTGDKAATTTGGYLMLLLGDGGITHRLPPFIDFTQGYKFELGWMRTPDERRRVSRSHDETGKWVENIYFVERRRI